MSCTAMPMLIIQTLCPRTGSSAKHVPIIFQELKYSKFTRKPAKEQVLGDLLFKRLIPREQKLGKPKEQLFVGKALCVLYLLYWSGLNMMAPILNNKQ